MKVGRGGRCLILVLMAWHLPASLVERHSRDSHICSVLLYIDLDCTLFIDRRYLKDGLH
jgi:hypothetical protein